MSASQFRRIAAFSDALALCNLLAPPVRADGGGSSTRFSLDRFSAARHGVRASDILVDDPRYDNAVVVALPGTALRLLAEDNLDALCFGLDNGIPGMWPFSNDINWPWIVYQFPAGRGAVDGFEGPLRLPFEFPTANPLISVTATLEGDTPAAVIGAAPFMCGTPPGDPPCCGECFMGRTPPCPPGIADAFYSCRLDASAPPAMLDAWNVCIGQFYVALPPGGPPGWGSLTVSGSMVGPDGSVLVFEPVQAEIRVIEDCDADGTDDPVAVGHGLAPDCNENDTVDFCDLAGGFSVDCAAGLQDRTTRVSVSSAGAEADDCSLYALSLSANGRFIAFTSAASNLAPGDDNAAWDVFLRDRDADEDGRFDEPNAVATSLVSRALDGTSGNGTSSMGGTAQSPCTISADGRYVVFDSNASDLVASDTPTRDVFL